jgi:putative transposase
MEIFRKMVNDCIRIGLENNVSTRIKLTKLCYHELANYDVYSVYKICAISHAAGILANRKTSIRRGLEPRQPYAKRPLLATYTGFKIADGILKVPLGDRQYFDISLNSYIKGILSDPSLSPVYHVDCWQYSQHLHLEVAEIECACLKGVDRNLRNLTIGNCRQVEQYDLSKAVDIVENTRSITKSFERNDVRIRRKLYVKYGNRRRNRINQLLHHISKAVVQSAKKNKAAIAFEDIRHIRRLYQKGNYQGTSYRGRMNSWSFAGIKRLITYKAAWEGVPVIQLSVAETRGTSQLCPRCGKKITQVDRKTRQLWCDHCKRWMDRDVVGAMNTSIKGRSRFERSQGLAGEAMKGNPTTPVILRVVQAS